MTRVALALVCIALPSRAEVPADLALRGLVEEALEARVELAEVRAKARAAKERVPQAQAWPEPMLQVGVQNDSFNRWQVGTMETSWVSFMASQTFPFPGKLDLRGEIAKSDARLEDLLVERVRLSTIAEVRRRYLALQLVRERKLLLERLISLSTRLVEVARIRLESQGGAQSEVLRARLELSRVSQRGFLLEAEEQLQLQTLNRFRKKPLDTPIATTSRLTAQVMPDLLAADDFLALARQHSPELLAAQADTARAQSAAALARRDFFPDVSISAGVMFRGRLDAMWALTVGVPLPVFAGARQSRAVNGAEAQLEAANLGAEGVEQQLRLDAHQRAQSLKALDAMWRSSRELLAQAAAVAESTLAQYAAGRAALATVLEANAVSISETEASLEVLANAWRLAIEQDELRPGASGGKLETSIVRSASPTSPSSGM